MLVTVLATHASACATPPSAVPPTSDGRHARTGHYDVALAFEPPAPAVGDLFRARVQVQTTDGRPLERGDVVVDARMPQHGHGMQTRPVSVPGRCADGVCVHDGGVYVVEGLRFHMPGAWTVQVDVTGPAGHDAATFVVAAP